MTALGRAGQERPSTDIKPLKRYLLTGAHVSTLKQKHIEKGIKDLKAGTERPTTLRQIDLAILAVEEHTGSKPQPEAISQVIQHKALSRQVRFFLWRLVHDAYRVGQWWKNIPEREDRTTCGVEESMDHILFRCEAIGREIIWKMATNLIETKTGVPR